MISRLKSLVLKIILSNYRSEHTVMPKLALLHKSRLRQVRRLLDKLKIGHPRKGHPPTRYISKSVLRLTKLALTA